MRKYVAIVVFYLFQEKQWILKLKVFIKNLTYCDILLILGKPQTHLKMSCKQCGSIIKRINLNQQKKCRVTDTIIKE